MFVHIWRMRARKKRVEDYEKFGRQVTVPSLKKIEGCLGAHFIRTFEARKPEYLWLVFWKDQKALEAARTNPVWREQIKKFEAGKFYKTIPLELVCECLDSFGMPAEKPKRAGKAETSEKAEEAEKPPAEEPDETKSSRPATPGPTPEGE
ncbi:MAG: antibiotic biosynthesis monooxygenase [Acidobacteriia bacterium]|nr:antibiotic biosynthesis monooxygenase [Terriglobia bacterium]